VFGVKRRTTDFIAQEAEEMATDRLMQGHPIQHFVSQRWKPEFLPAPFNAQSAGA
jgi:hypothetical protein